MKKVFAVVLVSLLCLCSIGYASGIDLTGLSFDELIQLRKEIDLLIFGSEEYKEVSVPAGDYVIGEDIPAGTYSLDCNSVAMIEVYSDTSRDFMSMLACHPVGDGETVGKIELIDGQAVSITLGSIIFKTYTGLGF